MSKTGPLIRTKLHPPFTRQGMVPRPRLQEQIARGLGGPLTMVTAPAGFGKTTLVASSIAGCGLTPAWLSLDKNDNQTGRFLRYIVATLQEVDLAIGAEAVQLLAAQQAIPEAVLTSLVNDLDTVDREIVLVLDDYQYIHTQVVHDELAFLLEHCPNTFHLVIATRSDPPLPLARLRAHGQVVELRVADLRFTGPEAAQFLNEVMGLHLDAGSVAVLEERTEGWIAGLQMAALSMRNRKDVLGFIEGFSGTNRHILDYLMEEVLASQPPEIQHFLLYTSILERLTAPLCDAVLAGGEGLKMEGQDQSTGPESHFASPSASILEYLDRANLFLVSLDDNRSWYRYHHLFADLLQFRLHQAEPGRVGQLLSRAAAWCDRDGQVGEAVGYALTARDYPRAAGLVEKYWGVTLNEGEVETVWSWLAALPEEVVRNSAALSNACGWVRWLAGQTGAIEPHLVDAENALIRAGVTEGARAGDEGRNGLLTMIGVLRSIVARHHNDYAAACTHAEQALALLPENLPSQENAILRTLIFLALANAYEGAGETQRAVEAYRESIRLSRLGRNAAGVTGMTYWLSNVLRLLGRLNEAETACQEALRFIEEQGMDRLPASGILHVVMAGVLVERNELEAAESRLARAIELSRRSGRMDAVRNSVQAQVRLRLAFGDDRGAMEAVEQAESALGEAQSPLSRAELFALKARILAREGSLAEAEALIEEAARLAAMERGWVREIVSIAAIRVGTARSQPGAAVTKLTRSLTTAEENGRLGVALEMRILRALALQRQGAAREAEADLQGALVQAEPEGYVRIFLDEGQPMQMLLAQWLAHEQPHASPGSLGDYAVRLLSQFEAGPTAASAAQKTTSPAGGLIEPLSRRELEVLHLLALGRTNLEIAQQLIVSPGTVKAHTARIYRKLDVANRTEAVGRARQLGILP